MQGQPTSQQKTLLLDMKVRWGSTLAMLRRANDLKSVSIRLLLPIFMFNDYLSFKFVNDFVYELGRDKSDHTKRAKIDSLKLSDDEWSQVSNFIDLLKVSSNSCSVS